MPRLHETIGQIAVSADEAAALHELLRRNADTANNPRLAAMFNRLGLRCQDLTDGVAAAEAGLSLAEFRCPGHRWVYTGTAYGGDDDRYQGEGRCYCALCGADGDA